MSHLKKLSERLGYQLVPRILPITTLQSLTNSLLESYSFRPISISQSMKTFFIPSLLMSVSHYGLCSLSANQLLLNFGAFAMHKELENGKWTNYQSSMDHYQVYISPKVLAVNDPMAAGIEECPSVPHLFTKIERHHSIKVEYMDVNGEYVEEEMEGFKARVFMHEIDHLDGLLMSSFTVNAGEIFVKEPEKWKELKRVVEEWKEKLNFDINVLEERYLCDKKFKEKADKYGDKREYFIQEIVTDEFDSDFQLSLAEILTNTQ